MRFFTPAASSVTVTNRITYFHSKQMHEKLFIQIHNEINSKGSVVYFQLMEYSRIASLDSIATAIVDAMTK